MRAVLLNETSDWHSGSAAASSRLLELLELAGHEVLGRVGTFAVPLEQTARNVLEIVEPELVVVHGEGTMNSNASPAQTFLELGAEWKRRGATVFLVNSLWQDMGADLAAHARTFDRIFLREPRSAREAEASGLEVAGVRVDLAVGAAETYAGGLDLRPALEGPAHGDGDRGHPIPWHAPNSRRVSLRVHGWNDAIRKIRTAELYVTGEHHGVLAAAIAGTPFASLAPVTHKLESLFEWAECPEIPLARCAETLEDAAGWALRPEGRRVQERFFEWLAAAPRLEAEDLAA